jgi:preprotein translocase subunit SecA
MGERVASEVVGRLFEIQIAREDEIERRLAFKPVKMQYGRGGEGGTGDTKPQTVIKSSKVGRNDPCICGSGKKYKRCCGQNE